MKRRSAEQRKGFTLSEICIALALVAIVSTIVTSFCLVMHRRSVISRARLDIVNELSIVETFVEKWVEEMSYMGATFQDNDGTLIANIRVGGTDNYYTATFSNGVLNGTVPDGETMTYTTTRIASVAFDFETQNDDTIFFCTVNALLPQANGEEKVEEYTFCINSRIGESFEEGTTGE